VFGNGPNADLSNTEITDQTKYGYAIVLTLLSANVLNEVLVAERNRKSPERKKNRGMWNE
jgi:hypothetical protein